jgi:aspartyl aminopeptidase
MPVIPGLLAAPEAATRFVQFVNASPTPFHAVHNAALRLEKAGFAKVCLRSSRALPVFSASVD